MDVAARERGLAAGSAVTAFASVALAGGEELSRPEATSRRARWAERVGSRVLVQTLVCCVPAAFLLAVGSAQLAGWTFWATLGALVVRLAFLRRVDELLCVVLAVAPFVNLLRGFAFYNVVGALYGGAVLLRFWRSPRGLRAFLVGYPLVPWLAAYLSVYWLLSFVLTGRYDVNFRVFEMLAAVVAVLIVTRRVGLIAAALRGLVVSSCAMALGLLPHLASTGDNRLGIVVLEGFHLGNPIQLGLPLALSLVALFADEGYWLKLRSRPFVRLLIFVPVGALLALTTSRAAWLVAFAGLLCAFLLSRRSRVTVLAGALVGLVIFQAIRLSPAGNVLDAGVDRTFGAERTTRSRTSGRSDQWIVAWHAVTDTAGSLLWGYGPGSGAEVYARKSLEVANIEFEVGREMSLHSLFMQVAVESGLIGLILLLGWCIAGAVRVVAWSRRFRLALPMAGYLGFILIAATVSGTDTVSGMFLGLGLFATGRESGPRMPVAGRAATRKQPQGKSKA